MVIVFNKAEPTGCFLNSIETHYEALDFAASELGLSVQHHYESY